MTEKLPFRPGKLRITGHAVIRATVTPVSKDDEPSGDTNAGWHLDVDRTTGPAESKLPFVLIGDLHVTVGGRFLGVTVGSSVELPPRVKASGVPTGPLLEALSYLYAESLWDAAASIARQLAGLTAFEEFRLPLRPPATGHFKVDLT